MKASKFSSTKDRQFANMLLPNCFEGGKVIDSRLVHDSKTDAEKSSETDLGGMEGVLKDICFS